MQSVLRKTIIEKYNTNPNFEYSLKNEQNKFFKCFIKIRQEYQLCEGESDLSKNKAKENAIKNALKLLIPNIYNLIMNNFSDNAKIASISNSCFNKTDTNNITNTFTINNIKSIYKDDYLSTDGKLIIDEIIDLNDTISVESNKSFGNFHPAENNCENDLYTDSNYVYLNKKRKISDLDIKNLTSKKKNIRKEVDIEECIFGGCLKEEIFGNLDIDDPIVIDKYLKCSNFTPLLVNKFFDLDFKYDKS